MTTATKTKPTYLNHFKTALGLTVFFSGHPPIAVAKANALFADLEAKLRDGLTDGLYELANLAARIKAHSKGKFLLVEKDGQDVILLHGKPMPDSLSEFTLQFVEQGFNTDFIERFWKNCCANPSQESRDALYGFIDANGMTLTDDGCFIGYRSIRWDWTDHHTGTMDNSIGKTVSMDRSKVDPVAGNTCSSGLHVAAWGYASTFYGTSRKVEVKVNPKNVVTVPPDYGNQKMRVCEFTVVNEVENKRDTLLHPDTFADADDWNEGIDASDVDIVDDSNVAIVSSPVTQTFVLNVCSNGGVNIPKELAKLAGFKVGDTANACLDTGGYIRVSKACCGVGDSCASRTVDVHNSIRLGSALFKEWDLNSSDTVEAVIVDDGSTKYIEIS